MTTKTSANEPESFASSIMKLATQREDNEHPQIVIEDILWVTMDESREHFSVNVVPIPVHHYLPVFGLFSRAHYQTEGFGGFVGFTNPTYYLHACWHEPRYGTWRDLNIKPIFREFKKVLKGHKGSDGKEFSRFQYTGHIPKLAETLKHEFHSVMILVDAEDFAEEMTNNALIAGWSRRCPEQLSIVTVFNMTPV